MSYVLDKQKHAYMCYKAGKPRYKVYAVVECGIDKYAVLNMTRGEYKFALAGGTIEDGETIAEAIQREVLEELNIECEYVKTIGHIVDTSDWTYKDESFTVDDDMTIVLVKSIRVVDREMYGIEGEFDTQDVVSYVTKLDMLANVAEFVKYGVKFD